MLKLKDKSISAYKGDYRPVEVFENAKKIHGFQTVGISGNETLFENTYNDAISFYGKSGYAESVNLCPPPEAQSGTYTEGQTEYPWGITPKENGYFDFFGYMVPGADLPKAKLAAGTYTVSGCRYISLWWQGRSDFLQLPATFTLDKETEVIPYLWYTECDPIILENQYIQIEKGGSVSKYSPYAGNSDFPASPDNLRKINSATGEARIEGANLLPPDFGRFSEWELENPDEPNDGFFFYLDITPGEYVLRFNVDNSPSDGSYGYVYIKESTDNGKTYKTVHYIIQFRNVFNRYTFTVKENCKYKIWAWRLMVDREDLFSGWSLQKTDIPDGQYTYFPTYNITCTGLEGIRVDENEAYNYCEEINGEKYYYISNILSGSSIKRNVAEAVITGQEVFKQKEIESGNFNCYYCDLSHIIKRTRNADKFLCNYFETLDNLETEKIGALLGQNDTNLYFFVEKSKFNTLDDFVNWVRAVYQKEKPISFYYILDAQSVERSELETPLRSYPMYTRILATNTGDLNLGFSSCIKIQNKGDN